MSKSPAPPTSASITRGRAQNAFHAFIRVRSPYVRSANSSMARARCAVTHANRCANSPIKVHAAAVVAAADVDDEAEEDDDDDGDDDDDDEDDDDDDDDDDELANAASTVADSLSSNRTSSGRMGSSVDAW